MKRFFEEFVVKEDQERLAYSFEEVAMGPAEPLMLRDRLEKVVNLLYDTRCDVIHAGATWGRTFHDGVTSMISGDPPVEVKVTITDLQRIIVKGCIAAIIKKFP